MMSEHQLDEVLFSLRCWVIYRIANRLGCEPDLNEIIEQMKMRNDREILEALIEEQNSLLGKIISRFRRWRGRLSAPETSGSS
jgi:hypothetical protein